ncbi:Major facilitator superfamily [Neofusicoccum parvum]|uniref:Major facilitator superfamily n=1 Tax=Neofusicoccum parvum TaxID=310453 RepID=A0ACB5SR97_9PEZI|nr:Major facilitator superfamily [Neofusicoccum parvum]
MRNDTDSLPEMVIEEPSDDEIMQDASVAPDGGYGWVCVFCVFLVNACTWGVVSAYGVFLSYYLSTSAFPSGTSLDYAFIGGLQFGCALSISTPVTILTRCFGIHIPILFGIVAQTAGFILASFASRIWQLYLTQGALVGVGIGFTYLPSAVVVSQWFDKKRSLANGIVSAGAGIGGIVFTFAEQAVIDQEGLGWALRMVGIVSGAANLVAVALMRSRNKETVSPLCAEVAGLKDLNSLLALMWITIVLPCTFSEVIALKIRRPDSERPYLYPQIFSGILYAISTGLMFRLWRVQRRKGSGSL